MANDNPNRDFWLLAMAVEEALEGKRTPREILLSIQGANSKGDTMNRELQFQRLRTINARIETLKISRQHAKTQFDLGEIDTQIKRLETERRDILGNHNRYPQPRSKALDAGNYENVKTPGGTVHKRVKAVKDMGKMSEKGWVGPKKGAMSPLLILKSGPKRKNQRDAADSLDQNSPLNSVVINKPSKYGFWVSIACSLMAIITCATSMTIGLPVASMAVFPGGLWLLVSLLGVLQYHYSHKKFDEQMSRICFHQLYRLQESLSNKIRRGGDSVLDINSPGGTKFAVDINDLWERTTCPASDNGYTIEGGKVDEETRYITVQDPENLHIHCQHCLH